MDIGCSGIEKRRILKKIFDFRFYLAAWTIPMVCVLLVYYKIGIYPFGNKTMVIWDCNNQYIDFFQYLRNCFANSNNLFYSFSTYLGGSMVQFASYYYLSPFNLFIFLFPPDKMYAVFSLLFLLKVSASGVTFYIFLKNQRKKIGWVGIVFSTAYALNIFSIVYSFHIMWLDGVILLPLVVMGLEQLCKGEGKKLYIIALSCAIISNFYIGYMLCIVSAIYFLFYLCLYRNKDKIICFVGASLAAGGLGACVWLPMWFAMKGGKAVFDIGVLTFEKNFVWVDFFKSLVKLDFDPNQLWNGKPNVFCGGIIILFMVLFLINRNIPWKEKFHHCLIVGVLCISFWVQAFDLIWHGFNFPRSFPHRYSFLFLFWMISMAAKGCCEMFWAVERRWSGKYSKLAGKSTVFLVGFLQIEMLISSGVQVIGQTHDFASLGLESYQDFNRKTSEAVKELESMDSAFYRIEKDVYRSYNDAMASSFNGFSHFSSCLKSEVCDFVNKLGVSGSDISICYSDVNTQALDSMLGIKYYLDFDGYTNKSYEFIKNKNGVNLYRNNYAFPIMLATESGKLTKQLSSKTPFDAQSEIYRKIVPGVDIFTDISNVKNRQDGTLDYLFYVEEEKPIYLNTKISQLKSLEIYADDVIVRSYSRETNRSIQYIGTFPRGTLVSVKVDVKGKKVKHARMDLVYENMEALEKAKEKICQGELHKISSSHLKGNITVDYGNGSTLLFLIPFDEQWKCYVDGRKVKQERVLDIFMSVPIKAGQHCIELYYRPKGILLGCGITLGTIICLFFLGHRNLKTISEIRFPMMKH